MKRRQILTTTAIGLGSAALGARAGQQQPQGSSTSGDLPGIRWRMATSWPASLDIVYGSAITIAERLRALSEGRFVITPYPAGELVPGTQVLDGVQSGVVECGHTTSHYYIGKNPAFAFATTVPFGLNAQQQNAWLASGGGNEAINRLYGDFGLVAFAAGNSGAQMGGWFKRPAERVADLQGLKMRIPGLGGEVMAKLGVDVQALPPGEILAALEQGAIDAAEWIGPYDDEKLGFAKAARFYHYPGWWSPSASTHAIVNRSQWQALPEVYRQMFRSACSEANSLMLSRYESLNGPALQRLLAGGTMLVPFSRELLKAAHGAAFQMYADLARDNGDFRRIYGPWTAFRQAVRQWNTINEASYADLDAEA